MADEQFYTILTTVGKAKVANAALLNSNVTLKTLKVGDSNGSYYNPTEEQTELKNVVYSCNVGSVQVDKNNPNWIIAETIIPGSVGGFTIREIGLFDTEGDLIAIGKYPETYKPVVANGASKDLCVRTIFEVSNAASVNLSINPSVIIATKEDINNLQEQIDEHKEEYTELKDDVEQLSNPNLLINAYFKNPVNQRGQTKYDIPSGVKIYTIDRWLEGLGGTITLTDKGIQYKRNTERKRSAFCQLFENKLPYGTYTLSFKKDGEIFNYTNYLGDYPTTKSENDLIRFETEQLLCSVTIAGIEISIKADCDDVVNIEWVKLEYGNKATPFYPRPYTEEELLCKRYFNIIYNGMNEGEYNNSVLPQSHQSNFIATFEKFPVKMRTTPTVTYNTVKVVSNSKEVTGFSFTTRATDNSVSIMATKANHGLTSGSCNISTSQLCLDAEIY